MKIVKSALVLTLLTTSIFFSSVSLGQTPSVKDRLVSAKAEEIVMTNDVIWGFDFLGEDKVLASLRGGRLVLIDLATKKMREIGGAPEVVARGQGGLLDLKLFSDAKKRWVYVTAAVRPTKGTAEDREKKTTTALFRAELSGTVENLAVGPFTRLFEGEPAVGTDMHYGSRIAMTGDSIYLAFGERNERNRSQDLNQHWGKAMRLTLEGKPYPGNPYEKEIGKARPEIVSFGHRNPQGTAIHARTGAVFISEHGPRGGDEINLVAPKANFGWPLVSYGREYWGPAISKTPQRQGVTEPVKYYVPSIAAGSLMIYSGKKHAFLKDHFFQGALVLQHLNVLGMSEAAGKWTSGEEYRLFEKMNERIRSIGESPSGEIYFGTDSGRFFRLAI